MAKEKKLQAKIHIFSQSEKRAARAERIDVSEAEPYGWIARSEADNGQHYHLFCDPETRHLACTCADFIYRGNAEPGFECKHIVATLRFIARWYLRNEYDPRKQYARVA